MRSLVCFSLIIVLVSLLSCSESSEANLLFVRADSLMDNNPDSALILLCGAEDASRAYPKSQRMRYELLRAKAMNKAYVDFTSDSVMKEVVEYYDTHGTANERVETHYLLGCVYRDLHESPAALSCYYDAVECADTLSEDCDFRTLMCLFGQIGDVLGSQFMVEDQIEAYKQYGKYALRNNDTLNAILSKDMLISPYLTMNDTSMVLFMTKEANKEYKAYGYYKEAARVYPSAIYLYLENQKYGKAKELMDIFESESGLFSPDGDICQGKEHYYNSKGLYYLGIGDTDSAKFYFKKLQKYFKYEAYRGMAAVFRQQNMPDSVFLYTKLFEDEFDSVITTIHIEEAFRVARMYDYTRNEKNLLLKDKQLTRNKAILFFVIWVSILCICCFSLCFVLFRNKKRRELFKLIGQYNMIASEQLKTKTELSLMEEDYENYKQEKKEELATLQKQLDEFPSLYEKTKSKDISDYMEKAEMIKRIKEKLRPKPNQTASISNDEWNEIFIFTKQYMGAFHSKIIDNTSLTEQETHIAVLTRLGFSTSEVAILLNTTNSRISNAKTSTNNKLFSEKTARTFNKNIFSL